MSAEAPARCWRCFFPRTASGDCPACGAAPAPSANGIREAAAAGAVAAAEPEVEAGPGEEVRAEAVPDVDDDLPGISSDDALDRLWEEESARRREKRARIVVAAVAVAAVLIGLAAALAAGRQDAPAPATAPTDPPDAGPDPDPDAARLLQTFGHGLRPRAAGLAVDRCEELPRSRQLRCTFRAGRVVAVASFQAIRTPTDGDALLEQRLTGATDISRVKTADGEAVTFRLALGGTDAQALPYVAWYAAGTGLYAEVSTTDEDPADLRRFYAEESR